MLSSWPVREAEDAALLIVSELVSNSVRYAAPPISLALTLITNSPSGSYELLIEVTDAETRLPAKRNPGESGGFGLSLVESLAKISFMSSDSGKTVRALLTTSRDHT
jgi:two-component sensor histidine kinase